MQTLSCMSPDCPAFFPGAEAARVLSRPVLAALDKIKQQAELAEAGIIGLESCPFCPFAQCIEEPFEVQKLFTCGREGCEIVSCRKCRKVSSLLVEFEGSG